jgi:DNA invertase Pin-like site-specific DNA recombinase
MVMEGSQEHAAVYVRTATLDRARDALAEQEDACRALGAARGYALDPARVYRDVGAGLALDDRAGLSLLRDDIAHARIAVVVALSPDRLSRDAANLAVLTDEAEAAGVRLEYVNVPPALKFAGWPTNAPARVSS